MFYLLRDKKPYKVKSYNEYYDYFYNSSKNGFLPEDFIIGRDFFENEKLLLSTVFLGIDHSGFLFETILFYQDTDNSDFLLPMCSYIEEYFENQTGFSCSLSLNDVFCRYKTYQEAYNSHAILLSGITRYLKEKDILKTRNNVW